MGLLFVNEIVCRDQCFHVAKPLPACKAKVNTLHNIWERLHRNFYLVPDDSVTAKMKAIMIMIKV
jgi:hypothetical protein